MTISVLLVDNHATFREGVRAWLETAADLCIVGEAGNREEALAMAENLRPDVVVTDCPLPGVSGMDIIPLLRKLRPDIRVVVLTLHQEEAYLLSAICNGARAYILKEDVVYHLIKAVAAAAAGKYYFSPCFCEWVSQSGLISSTGAQKTDSNASLKQVNKGVDDE